MLYVVCLVMCSSVLLMCSSMSSGLYCSVSNAVCSSVSIAY